MYNGRPVNVKAMFLGIAIGIAVGAGIGVFAGDTRLWIIGGGVGWLIGVIGWLGKEDEPSRLVNIKAMFLGIAIGIAVGAGIGVFAGDTRLWIIGGAAGWVIGVLGWLGKEDEP